MFLMSAVAARDVWLTLAAAPAPTVRWRSCFIRKCHMTWFGATIGPATKVCPVSQDLVAHRLRGFVRRVGWWPQVAPPASAAHQAGAICRQQESILIACDRKSIMMHNFHRS